jgi:hypothetical protein
MTHTHDCTYCGTIGDCLDAYCKFPGMRVHKCPYCPRKSWMDTYKAIQERRGLI